MVYVGEEGEVEDPVRVRTRTFGNAWDNSSGDAVYDVRESVVTLGNTALGDSRKWVAEKSALAMNNLEREFLFWIKILPTPFSEETGTSFMCRLSTTFKFRKEPLFASREHRKSAAVVSISDSWIELRYFSFKMRSAISGYEAKILSTWYPSVKARRLGMRLRAEGKRVAHDRFWELDSCSSPSSIVADMGAMAV